MLETRRRNLSIIVLAAVSTVVLPAGLDAEPEAELDPKALHQKNSSALPHSYLVTLVLEDGDAVHQFSTVTAQRHFAVAPPERRFDFRASLRMQPDGRELLDFSVELQQQFTYGDGETSHTRVGSWKGSTYIETDRTIPIIENPNSKLTVRLKKL